MILTRPPNGEKSHKRLTLSLLISARKKAAKGRCAKLLISSSLPANRPESSPPSFLHPIPPLSHIRYENFRLRMPACAGERATIVVWAGPPSRPFDAAPQGGAPPSYRHAPQSTPL